MRLEIGAARLPEGSDRKKLIEDLTASLEGIGYEITDVELPHETNGFDLVGRNDLLTTKDVRRLERVIKGHGLSTGLREGQVVMAVFSE